PPPRGLAPPPAAYSQLGAVAAKEDRQGCERFLRAPLVADATDFVPRQRHWKSSQSSFVSLVQCRWRGTISKHTATRGARKKRSHLWLPSLCRYRGVVN